MLRYSTKTKVAVIVFLLMGMTALHYFTQKSQDYYHIFYRELYYLPIIMSGLWFGLRGGLIASISTCLLYSPLVFMNWEGFSANDFDIIMELVLYNVVAMLLGILADRERKNQALLRRAERLASMGQALSGVAHDIKTPLVAIGGYVRLVQKNFKKENPSYKKLDIVIGEILRLEKMVKDMLDFSRPLKLHRTIEDIGEVIEEGVLIVEPEAKKRRIQIKAPEDKDPVLIAFDRTRIKQVFINLLMNAIQASRKGGVVSVSVTEDKKHINIDIADCGCGLPSEDEQIFTPFYTTKREGTGLGLATVKKIVQAHDGNISIVRNTPEGSTFRLMLPKKLSGAKCKR